MAKAKPVNELKCAFPSWSANEALARSVAASFAAQLNPTCEEVSDLKCAVSEAVTNAIVHGYRDTVGEIQLILKLYDLFILCIDLIIAKLIKDPLCSGSLRGNNVSHALIDSLSVSAILCLDHALQSLCGKAVLTAT